jgi:virginiamycin B lyase
MSMSSPTRTATPRRIATAVAAGAAALSLVLGPAASAAAGRIKEFVVPTQDSHPGGVVLGPDGGVWFTELATGAIATLKNGTITEFPLPSFGEPVAIEQGSDGALWFTEYASNEIGRITTSGVVTEFAVPPCQTCDDVGPWDIVAGPDGALWFTELDANRIGRITTAGAITQFDLPGGVSVPIGITNGPDGALWFTDSSGVGRIATDGTITQRWTGGSSPAAITTGSDGRLWFTQSSQVGRLDPSSGQVKLFSIDLNCFAQDIATGAGAVWFTCYFLDEVGRVTPDGRVTPFRVPNHFGGNYPDTLEGIAPGANHDMWFTEEAANRIGRISTS